LQTEQSLSGETQDALPGANAETASPQSDAGAKQNWSGPHPVDIRLTIPLLSGRYYFTILAGHERRSADRLRADRRLHPLLKV